jgi:hypothetical protein
MLGDLPSGEMFSRSVSLGVSGFDVAAALAFTNNARDNLAQADFDDLVSDVTDYWSRYQTWISARAILKTVKLAPIGANGAYTGPAREAAVNVPGGASTSAGYGEMLPHQISRKVTLETDGDLSRIKGGWYLPGCSSQGFDAGSNLWSATVTSDCRDSTDTFLEALANSTGLDALGSYKVVVASQGRNRNGAQVVAPGNWEVKRVNIGRRLDVQRRRANKLSEARIADADVSQ